jgi:hypothetical protein
MDHIYIKGLSDAQIARILGGKKSSVDIAYANVKAVVYVPVAKNIGLILFDGQEDWTLRFDGGSDDFLKRIAGQ